MTLNEDLVRRAIGLTPSLSEIVERLLAPYIESAEVRAAQREQQIAAQIGVSDAFVANHGSLADAFGNL